MIYDVPSTRQDERECSNDSGWAGFLLTGYVQTEYTSPESEL
jgi:hypothetical protein